MDYKNKKCINVLLVAQAVIGIITLSMWPSEEEAVHEANIIDATQIIQRNTERLHLGYNCHRGILGICRKKNYMYYQLKILERFVHSKDRYYSILVYSIF